MKIHTFETRMTAHLAVQETFSVFENPYNLARITPPWLSLEIQTEGLEMRKGLEIDYTLRWLGVPLRWKTRIVEYVPPFLFIDEMRSGPYALWRHEHTFRPSEEGTIVTDRVSYALPYGVLGMAAHAIVVRRQIEKIFAFRQKALAEMFCNRRTATAALP